MLRLDEFISQRQQVARHKGTFTDGSKWWQGSTGEVKHKIKINSNKRKGIAKFIMKNAAGVVASLSATGVFAKEHRLIKKIEHKLEENGVASIVSANQLLADLYRNLPRDVLIKSATSLKDSLQDSRKNIQQLIRAVDRYKRITAEEKDSRGLLGKLIGDDEWTTYDFNDLHNELAFYEDVANTLDKAVVAIFTENYEIANKHLLYALKSIKI